MLGPPGNLNWTKVTCVTENPGYETECERVQIPAVSGLHFNSLALFPTMWNHVALLYAHT